MTAYRAALLLSPLMLVAACQTNPPAPAPASTASPIDSGSCHDGPLQWAVGQNADEATMRKLTRQAGPVLINPIGPATIVSHDQRSDRLRVFLDANNRITAVRCE